MPWTLFSFEPSMSRLSAKQKSCSVQKATMLVASRRRIHVFISLAYAAAMTLDVTLALVPSDNSIGQGAPKSRSSRATRVNSVLPPMTEVETVQKRRNSSKKNSPKRKKNKERIDERQLPTNIPKLSDILHSSTELGVEKQHAPKKPTILSRQEQVKQTRNDPEPWKASFKTSIRTQGRLRKEFESRNPGELPTDKSKRILRALLSTRSTHCNAANIVAALTFSAKALGSRIIEPDEELRSLLFETLNILKPLVQQRELTTRQLCNACWAIAKHYDRDNYILPSPPEPIALSSEEAIGTAEYWDIFETDELKEQQEQVDKTINEIAHQLTLIFEDSHEPSIAREASEANPLPAKIGEICMATWAFGKLRHRSTPPGWEVPPQLGKLPNTRTSASVAANVPHMPNLITFEQWGSFGRAKTQEDSRLIQTSELVTGKLFDSIASVLCSPSGQVVAETDQKDLGLHDGHRFFLAECSWSELANVGWSFASHGRCKSHESEVLLQNLAREACKRLSFRERSKETFLVRDIAQLLWALGTSQADNFRIADDMVLLVEALTDYLGAGVQAPTFARGRQLARWSCADLVQVALSLAHARIDELSLLRAIYAESHHRLLEIDHSDLNKNDDRTSFRPWEVSILLWAQARLHLTNEQGEIFEDFAVDAPRFLLSSLRNDGRCLFDSGIGAQEQANIAWSLTVLQRHQSKEAIRLLNMIFLASANACRDNHTIQLEHAHQLWQAYFLLEEESPDCIRDVPSWFAEYLESRWTLEKGKVKHSSARHRSLSQTLDLMGVRHYNEHDEDIDVAIILKDDASWTHETDSAEKSQKRKSIAVEFDGPNHFTRERQANPRALGHTILKYRLLKKQGWSVVRVPYFEFDKIPFWASMVSAMPCTFFATITTTVNFLTRYRTINFAYSCRSDNGISSGN